ncbi:MAG: 2Fe-2S iron-sulfur cluster-binding protein, partial [Pseudomonadota bacterium]
MSKRLAKGGLLIDRNTPVYFSFNGRKLRGFVGDTLASALLAQGHGLVGRSFKYHRRRGIVASGVEEPNALMNLGDGDRLEPNQRATTTEVFEGLQARSQNHWPSLEFDIGALNTKLARFFPAGFYYKTFMWPRAAWKHVFEPVIRQSAGLGAAPDRDARDPDSYEHFYAYVDVLVIGAGAAGLAAARASAQGGARVLILEQTATIGGRALVDHDDGKAWTEARRAELEAMPNVTFRTRTMGAGVYDHGYVLAYERLTDHAPTHAGPRHRLWRIRAKQVITASGALERPLAFAGNDVPGVMLASAVRDYVRLYGVSPGDRTVLVTNNDDAYRTALALLDAGLTVPAVLDARTVADGPLP